MIISSSSSLDEESLVDLLCKVLLIENNDVEEDDEIDENEIEINGLEDLIPYISGLVSTQLQERRSIKKLPIDDLHSHVSFRISRS